MVHSPRLTRSKAGFRGKTEIAPVIGQITDRLQTYFIETSTMDIAQNTAPASAEPAAAPYAEPTMLMAALKGKTVHELSPQTIWDHFMDSLIALMAETLDDELEPDSDFLKGLPAMLLKRGNFKLQAVAFFDFPHPSDERCELRVLLLSGVPFALHSFVGDRSSYNHGFTVIEPTRTFEVASAIRDMQLERAWKDANSGVIQEPGEPAEDTSVPFGDRVFMAKMSGMGYLKSLGAGLFHVDNPRSCNHGFVKSFTRLSALFIAADGTHHPLKGFVQWASKRSSGYLTCDEDQWCYVTTKEGMVMQVFAKNIYFRLAPDVDQEALKLLDGIKSQPHSVYPPQEFEALNLPNHRI